MKKEIYKMQCPKHIVFGDPLYFDRFKGARLKSLVVDYKPPKHFEARLVLLEQKSEELEGFIERSMNLYLAPTETMKTYLDEMKYKDHKMGKKMIGVDTARYILEIDDRSDEIRTGGDGCWGSEVKLYRQVGNQKVSDAMIISVAMPEGRALMACARWPATFFLICSRYSKTRRKRSVGIWQDKADE